MIQNIITVLCFSSTLILALPAKIIVKSNSPRIVGGEEADIRESPSICSFRKNGRHNCAVNIINEEYCVTAAHCVAGASISSLSVICGISQLNSTEGEKEIQLVRGIIHPEYNPRLISNNFAVIQLAEKIEFNERKHPAVLDNNCDDDTPRDCKIIGWGMTSYPGTVSNSLQKSDSKTTTVVACKDALASVGQVTEKQICALTKADEGACKEDSWEPLFVDDQNYGIVSWGRPCVNGYPDVFTRVGFYSEWIKMKLNRNST